MLGVGWTEMLVIGVVALIVIGPKELPAVMNRIGKFAGTIRRMGAEFQRELNKTTGLNELTSLRNSVTAPLRATADAIRKEFNSVTPSGTVEPSGALKPQDPKGESVVDEIKAAAGLAPGVASTDAAPAAPAKPKRAPRIKAVQPDAPVVAADLAPLDAQKSATKPKAAPKPKATPATANTAAAAKGAPATAKSTPTTIKAADTAAPRAARPRKKTT
jgi:sec-independent protein translocase protein TatB